jgi:hypothetical protein
MVRPCPSASVFILSRSPVVGVLSRTNGYPEIESKQAMKTRGIKSPDRAEAVLLAIYEPEFLRKPRRRGLLN